MRIRNSNEPDDFTLTAVRAGNYGGIFMNTGAESQKQLISFHKNHQSLLNQDSDNFKSLEIRKKVIVITEIKIIGTQKFYFI